MKIELTTPPSVDTTKWPRLMRNTITGTIFLVASLDDGEAVDLERCHFKSVKTMAHNLEELPAGFKVTLVNE